MIDNVGQVTKFMQQAEAQLKERGQIHALVKDVPDCFPKMPKEAIRLALRSELKKVTDAYGFDAVTVPSCAGGPTNIFALCAF